MNDPKPDDPALNVPLRDPGYAALLAWAWPGLGHIYQRRYAKGALFMVCVLSTYFFGLALGEGRVVYASWTKAERRWQFVLQAGVGLPATPAVVQSLIVRSGGQPLFGGWFTPPQSPQQLADWHLKLNQRFEMGTLYTVVAGLLNVLVVFDALWGPAGEGPSAKKKEKPPGG